MINANVAFKSQIKKVNYADITLRDGTVLNLEPSDFTLGGFSMKDETTAGKFGIGNTVGKTISLTIANHTNKFSMYDFYKSIIYMYVSVTLEDGTILKERKGKYYVINPTSPGDVINLSGVDSMYLFDKPYNASTVYPATLQSILSDCCLDCGVNIGFDQFDNYDFLVENKPEDCTYRQVVSWVAQIAGYNARVSNADYLEMVWYDTSLIEDILDGGRLYSYDEEDTYDGGDFTAYSDSILWDGGNFTDSAPENVTRIKSISVSTDDVVITGVKVEYDNVSFLAGEEGYCITLSDNDLVAGKQAEIAGYLGNRLIGLRFRPLSCQIANNPLFEPFDLCYVYDRKGNAYFTFINSVSYSISGFTTIACKAEDPIRNESSYVSEAAKAVVEARRETKKELTTYDKAVQNMNMLAANAMGLYRESETLEDGSVIYYQSNRPIYKNEAGVCEFVTNSVVYKMTGDGFFVSSDGGLTYTSGFDSEGNAVVNVLSAIGITFDWAKGGILTLGGADNVNGILNVLDSDGVLRGKWTKDGIEMELSDGSKVVVSPQEGFYRLVGSSKNVYNSLFYTTSKTFYGIGSSYISLPDEFKGKDVKVFAFVKSCQLSGSHNVHMISYFNCDATYNSSDNTVYVITSATGYTMDYSVLAVDFLKSSNITKYKTNFLTSAYLSGSSLTTYEDSGISDIYMYDSSDVFVDSLSTSMTDPTIEVTIVALA